jgi:bifunctional DNA-binding transcriptional regulator/antitoxin component of YhaV-PrlF toxin-antitoxin module
MSKRARNAYQVRVSLTGTITLPKGWMKENNINIGDILTLVDLNGGVVGVRPQRSRFEGIADKLAKEWQDSGMSLESMLDTLQKVRAENIRKLS